MMDRSVTRSRMTGWTECVRRRVRQVVATELERSASESSRAVAGCG
eukprot:CAMPEP_0172088764 /NCGR_PEP_ID=MMETSP1043-20130122/23418_1 /TAXON_ID=464988 /ORGANISM="Hemiselmis andersenii, Strain CCMP441" /LENGTH=45 /DNA_ID= /DNA_START= /DNA_END= /DNA_ORIENTATION=